MARATGLSADQVAHYRDHGWVAPVDVLTEAEAADALDALEAAEAAFPDDLHAERRNNAHLVLPFLAELARHPVILAAAGSLVGEPSALLTTVLFVKEPRTGHFVSWHQDGTYMGMGATEMTTAWLALTPSTPDNGCVAMVPGSHRHGISPHVDRYGADNILTRGQHVEGVHTDTAVDIVLRPGQMSLHHPHLVHGSRPNGSDGRRVGVAFQSYVGTGARMDRGGYHVLPVGDGPIDRSFTVAPFPTGDFTDEGRATRDAADAAMAEILYEGAAERRQL